MTPSRSPLRAAFTLDEVLAEIATSVGLDARAVAAEVASGRPLKKFDTKTQRYSYFGAEAPDTYGIDVDQAGNVWFAQFNARDHQDIGMVDVKTNKITRFQPPAGVSSRHFLKLAGVWMR